MTMPQVIRIIAAAATLALLALPSPATRAQGGDAVGKIVVGYPPGQSVDAVARMLAGMLSGPLNRTMVVENIAGQSGSIALSSFARQPADGGTLTLAASASLAVNPVLYKNIKYDTLKDFEPVGLLYDAPLLLLVNADLPVDSVASLIAYVKQNAGKISYSSPGNGSVSHLAMTEFMRRTGLVMTHVPYQGAAKSLTDLSSGQVQVTFETIGAAKPFLKTGKIRPLAVSSGKRVAYMPQLPTVAESGLQGFDLVPWVGVLAPAGTPRDRVEKVADELNRIAKSEEFTSRMEALGTRPLTGTPDEFKTFLKSEVSRWAEVVRVSGARVD